MDGFASPRPGRPVRTHAIRTLSTRRRRRPSAQQKVVGRDALKVVLNAFGVLAMRCGSGNLTDWEWNCLIDGRLHSCAVSTAVFKTWIAVAFARLRPAMSWYMAAMASVSDVSRYSL